MKDHSRDLVIPGSLGLVTALLHILTASDTYGVFRDEFYYVANGRHLGFGYVEHPPLIGWLSRLTTSLFGESQLALRFFPAIAAGVTVFLVCRIAHNLGGGRWAQILAGVGDRPGSGLCQRLRHSLDERVRCHVLGLGSPHTHSTSADGRAPVVDPLRPGGRPRPREQDQYALPRLRHRGGADPHS